MNGFKNIVFALLLALLCLPLLQQKFNLVEVKPLSGAFNLPDTVSLNKENWFSGAYQSKYSPFYEYQIGFRPFFVKLRNQLYVWTYGRSDGYVVIGNQNQLFAWNYWLIYGGGGDFLGDEEIDKRFNSVVQFHEELKALNVPLLIVIGPNKVRHLAEYLPDNYQKEEQFPNNYNSWKERLKQSDIQVVDFNEVYTKLKNVHGTSIFPNTGTHWSQAGMAMALDSIVSYADRVHGDSLWNVDITNYFLADSIVDSDVDLRNDLNLLFPPKREKNLFARLKITKEGRKPKVFTIGDSFYWNLYQLPEFFEVLDDSSHFWYYNNSDIAFDGRHIPVEQFNAQEIAAKADIVVLMATEANFTLFPYEFTAEYLDTAKFD